MLPCLVQSIDGEGTLTMARADQQRRTRQRVRRKGTRGDRPTGPHEVRRPLAPPKAAPLSAEDRAALAVRTEVAVQSAAECVLRDDVAGLEERVALLVAEAPGAEELRVVQGAVVALLRRRIRTAWELGWQPVDVHTWITRRAGAVTCSLAASVMADELGTYARPTVDPDWYDQLAAIDARIWWPGAQTWAEAHVDPAGSPWPVVLEAAVVLVAELSGLWRLERFAPLPGHGSPTRRSPAGTDPRMLQRVRGLLAQAESTSFPEEAETFTATAQRLMARHSIDVAMLEDRQGGADPEEPSGRRLWVERPYVKEKVLLLTVVAEANRSRAVWFREVDLVTVLGHRADLAAVETLYTSLLVQATRAMQVEGGRTHADGTSRTRGFRQSFLSAYASRIGERLRQATAQETREAAGEFERCSGRELVPVLRAREEAVDAYTTRVFPRQVHRRVSAGHDAEGWARGRSAADRARLSTGPAVES